MKDHVVMPRDEEDSTTCKALTDLPKESLVLEEETASPCEGGIVSEVPALVLATTRSAEGGGGSSSSCACSSSSTATCSYEEAPISVSVVVATARTTQRSCSMLPTLAGTAASAASPIEACGCGRDILPRPNAAAGAVAGMEAASAGKEGRLRPISENEHSTDNDSRSDADDLRAPQSKHPPKEEKKLGSKESSCHSGKVLESPGVQKQGQQKVLQGETAKKDLTSCEALDSAERGLTPWDLVFKQCPPGPVLSLWRRRRWKCMADEGEKALVRSSTLGTSAPQQLWNGTLVPPRFWGISRRQVETLYNAAKQDSRWSDSDDVRTFVRKFVHPTIQGSGHGVALHLNERSPREANLMVSHSWSENVREFFEDFLGSTYDHEVAFICFLSNYQGTEEEIDQQLGKRLAESPFTQVIQSRSCSRMLVIPNETLRLNGEGLYSRLWCDWEIKVAADAGLPIHIPRRNTMEHLLGKHGGSSRHARCGDRSLPPNRDEILIRFAVESMPAETGQSHAVSICIMSVSATFCPEFAAKWLGQSALALLIGLQCGLVLGMMLAYCVSHCLRPKHRDGYDVLDYIIRGAAAGWYTAGRFCKWDMMILMAFANFLGILDMSLRRAVLSRTWACAELGYVEAVGASFVLWSLLHANKMGPWTGLYINMPACRWLCQLLMLACCWAGGFCNTFIRYQITGSEGRQFSLDLNRGMLCGWLLALAAMAMFARKWLHMLMNLWVIIALQLVHLVQRGVYHGIFVLLLGFNAAIVRPELGALHRAAIFILEICALAALLLLTTREERDILGYEQRVACFAR